MSAHYEISTVQLFYACGCGLSSNSGTFLFFLVAFAYVIVIKKNVVSPFSPSGVHENLPIIHELQFFTMAFMYSYEMKKISFGNLYVCVFTRVYLCFNKY